LRNSSFPFSSKRIISLRALSDTEAPFTIGIVIEKGFIWTSLASNDLASLARYSKQYCEVNDMGRLLLSCILNDYPVSFPVPGTALAIVCITSKPVRLAGA
jgi:hypothetical protein